MAEIGKIMHIRLRILARPPKQGGLVLEFVRRGMRPELELSVAANVFADLAHQRSFCRLFI